MFKAVMYKRCSIFVSMRRRMRTIFSIWRSFSIVPSLFYCLSTNFALILSVKRVILNISTTKI
nr:MAG TPA: hypothetical protein [Caudoviricetes sp.]